MAVSNPTLILGLGDLGGQVLARLALDQQENEPNNAVLLSVDLIPPNEEEESDEIVARLASAPKSTDDEAQQGDSTIERLTLSAPLSGADRDRVTALVSTRTWNLLTLDHFLSYSPATDLMRPRLSVFVVADLAEEPVRQVLDGLVELVARTLLKRYSHIFSAPRQAGEQQNFGLYPILFMGDLRSDDRATSYSQCLSSLAKKARQSVTWWPGLGTGSCVRRVVLFDDQTSKYVLTDQQVVSSLATFLDMALFSTNLADARRQESTWPLAEFLLGAPSGDPDALFATFGAATLDLSEEAIRTYIRNRLALALVDGMRPSEPEPPLGMKLRHMWWPEELDARLQRGHTNSEEPSAAEEIARHLQDLSGELQNRCLDVSTDDSPERILNDKYSWPWYEELTKRFTGVCQDLEDRLLPQAAEEIDRAGLNVAKTDYAELTEQVDRWVWRTAAGWHHGRQHLQELAIEAGRQRAQHEEQAKLVGPPDTGRVKAAIMEVRSVADRWPRRWRMWTTATLVVALLVGLFQFLPKWLYVRFIYENTEYVSAEKAKSIQDQLARAAHKKVADLTGQTQASTPAGMVPDPRYNPPSWLENPMLFKLPPSRWGAHLVVDRPYVFLWLFVLFGVLVWLVLRHHCKQVEADMDDAIRFLRHRIEELVAAPHQSAREYFEQRVQFSRDLWVRKLLTHIIDHAHEEVERLNLIDETLNQLRHRYREGQKRLGVRYVGPNDQAEDLSGLSVQDTDPFYRKNLDPEILIDLYQSIAENEVARVEEFFDEQKNQDHGKDPPDWRRDPRFAEAKRIEQYSNSLIEGALEMLHPVGALLETQGNQVPSILASFLADLTGKLSSAVELTTKPDQALTRLLLVPEQHAEHFAEHLAEHFQTIGLAEAQGQMLDIVPSRDPQRMQLLVGYSGLKLDQFRYLKADRPQGPSRKTPGAPAKHVKDQREDAP
ncbi:MAG: hypothetical protein J7M25_15660 [Deltaproteobacteria bacterium]|nr:hypothetical protein [Deltaproteobacteria bacterium]